MRWKISTSGTKRRSIHLGGVDSNCCGLAGDGGVPISDDNAPEKKLMMCYTDVGATPWRSDVGDHQSKPFGLQREKMQEKTYLDSPSYVRVLGYDRQSHQHLADGTNAP